MRKTFIAITTLLSLTSISANAELIAKDWASQGDELLSYDTVSGLNWLDLSMTIDSSYNEISARLNTDLDGWRLPNSIEVASLFASAYSEDITFNADGSIWVYSSGDASNTQSYNDASNFSSLFGNYGLNDTTYAYGLYKDDEGILRMTGTYLNSEDGARIYGMDYNNTYAHLENSGHLQFGVLLVANDMNLPDAPPELSNVPLPGSFALLTLAMLGFSTRRQYKE